ncbi:hypothetical protein [Candidatus Electrothrix sp.]|uniref:hypothetical protein n=1 Tax=Candidatus Electrothrix sp. TaxID=2170559 RepID=UPI004056FA3F
MSPDYVDFSALAFFIVGKPAFVSVQWSNLVNSFFGGKADYVDFSALAFFAGESKCASLRVGFLISA